MVVRVYIRYPADFWRRVALPAGLCVLAGVAMPAVASRLLGAAESSRVPNMAHTEQRDVLPMRLTRSGLPYYADPRIQKLERFFRANRSPIGDLAYDFLIAADENGLDWRLLPSLSMVESGGGKVKPNNNVFGWDNGRQGFSSVEDGIRRVAERLAFSNFYRGKKLDDLLRTYNPARPDYPQRVKSVMQTIDASASSRSF